MPRNPLPLPKLRLTINGKQPDTFLTVHTETTLWRLFLCALSLRFFSGGCCLARLEPTFPAKKKMPGNCPNISVVLRGEKAGWEAGSGLA